MALSNLTPVTRPEAILDGSEITPVTRREYFMKKAATSGGSGEKAVFNILEDEHTGDLYFADEKTIEDIDAAYQAGNEIVFKFGWTYASYCTLNTGEDDNIESAQIFFITADHDPQDATKIIDIDFSIIEMAGDGTLSRYGFTADGAPY